jgi:predicted MFS family arabinose efflux permease
MIDDPADLPNAIALNSAMVNIAKLGGPALATAIVGLIGEAWCFTIDATSYVAVVASLVAMNVRPARPRKSGRVLAELSSGLRYVRDTPVMRDLLVQLAINSLLAGAYLQLMPAVAAEQGGTGPYALGILMASGGGGALAGALHLANRRDVHGMRELIVRSRLVLGVAMIALELAPTTWLAAPAVFIMGMALMIQLAATNTLVQTLVEPALLGRVMSMYAFAVTGGMPLGALLEGAIANHAGAVNTLAGAGCLVVIATLVLGRRSLTTAAEIP